MSHWQLGEQKDALRVFAEADELMQAESPGNIDLLQVRREAADLLGIPEESPAPEQ